MTTPLPYLIQGNNVIVIHNGTSFNIGPDHYNYADILKSIKEQDWARLVTLLSPATTVVTYGSGNVEIKDGVVYWRGTPFTGALAMHMLRLHRDGFPVDPLINFMTRLMGNSSKRSIEQCYDFITRNNMPITPDGYFLAFKKVRKGTYKDIHSGTIVNTVGSVIEMPRNEVDDDPNSYCSAGLHFCSEEYLGTFGDAQDHVMILKIDPADVVSIPADANGAKGRCCRYTVVAELDGDPKTALARAVMESPDKKPEPVVSTNAAPSAETPAAKQTSGKAAWPFPGSFNGAAAATSAKKTNAKASAAGTDLYKLVKKSQPHVVVHTNKTYAEAKALIDKAVRQHKASLVMIKQ